MNKKQQELIDANKELVESIKRKQSARIFMRTCQECGHSQFAIEPTSEPSDAYCNAKCRKCKSESLDYGSSQQRYPYTKEEAEFINKIEELSDEE